jgi:hypothetical protein
MDKRSSSWLLGLGIVLLLSATGRAWQGNDSTTATAALQIIEPNGIGDHLAEIDDFATFHMGDPWDMEQQTDLQLFRTHDSFFQNERFVDGVFAGNMTRGDGSEYIMPLYAGAVDHDALRIGKIGYTYPIDASHYRYLTFRMYFNGPVCHTGIVRWSEDDTRTEAVSGVSNGFYVPPKPCEDKPPGWEIYVLDLKTIGIQWGANNWERIIRELRIIPVGGVPVGTEIRMDWIRLTAQDPRTARPYTIRWQNAAGPVTLYASRDNQVLDEKDILIATVEGALGQYVWQTGVLEAGTYHIYATDGKTAAWSPGPLVLNSVPSVEILAPSMTSGADYSAVEVGNPWDMNDPADINLNPPEPFRTCMDQTRFEDGIFHARTPRCPSTLDHNDPMIFLGGFDRYPPGTPDPEVDTQRYRYFSFRYWLEGEQNMAGGWVARVLWWKENATDNGAIEAPSTGRDIILYEGWNTYSLDLTAEDAVDNTLPRDRLWLDSHPNRMRLDPNELMPELSPGFIHLDWVKLTAMDEVQRGTPYTIRFVTSQSDVSYKAYYDTDRNPSNGLMPVRILAPSVEHGQYTVFLPLAFASYLDPDTRAAGSAIRWDTAGVPPGEYWIAVEVNDGLNTILWYSEAPVAVR